MVDITNVAGQVRALKDKYATRDRNAHNVRLVRRGKFDALSPDMFSDDWPAPIVANLVDNYCRNFGASLAPLPSFTCSSGNMLTEAAKKRAQLRTRVVNHYVEASNLAPQMLEAGDSFAAYGLMAFTVAPDMDERVPKIRAVDGGTVYPVWDRHMRTVKAAVSQHIDVPTLVGMYPQAESRIKNAASTAVRGNRVEVVTWYDKDVCATFLPELGNMVLESFPNPVGRCNLVAVPRPGSGDAFNGEIRGAYDDLVWPQIARHRFQLLALEGAEKTIRSPLVVPTDVTDVPMGDDAVIHTQNPQGVSKVQFQFPTAAYQAMESLRQEMNLGGMTPEALSGSIDASIVTGKGVEQLMQGYSTQIAAAQEMVRFALQQCIELCFLWDEKVWPNTKKTVRGTEQGAPFEVTYKPGEDIAGDHTVHIEYGFLAGLDANRALVYVLQARGDQLVSREFARKQLPAHLNVVEEERKIALENLDDSILTSMAGLAQSLPQLALNGMDPSGLVQQLADVRQQIRKGRDIGDAVADVFKPPEPPPAGQGGAGAAEGQPPAGPPGTPATAPGALQAADASGRPDLAMLMASLTPSGNANLQASVARQRPIM